MIEDPAPRMWWCEVEHEDEDDAYKDGNGVVDWGVVCVSGASDVNKTIAFNYRPKLHLTQLYIVINVF